MSPTSSTASTLELQALGPLEVRAAGEPVPLGGSHQRAILGLCLINRNRIVSVDSLIEEIWNGDPPRSAVSSVQVAVSGLRRVLPSTEIPRGGMLQTSPPGYRLVVDDATFDLAVFAVLRDRGAAELRAGRPERAAAELRSALGLWHGTPLEDLQRFRFAADFATALEEERLLALEMRLDADLRCHRYVAVLPELIDLTTRFPLREQLWAQQATTFYQLGRQADALATLQRLRGVLDDELGIDPSPAVRQLELDILRQDVPRVRTDPPAAAYATVGESTDEVAAELVSSTGEVFGVSARTWIGRAPESDIVVADDRASRQHAFVYSTPDGLMLSDLRSRNGTHLNGRRLVGDERLSHGDVIVIGRVSLTLQELPTSVRQDPKRTGTER